MVETAHATAVAAMRDAMYTASVKGPSTRIAADAALDAILADPAKVAALLAVLPSPLDDDDVLAEALAFTDWTSDSPRAVSTFRKAVRRLTTTEEQT